MKLQISKNANINYLAKVINIKSFTSHPNPEVTRMKIAHIDGYGICVGINEPEGWYVYFPVLSQLNPNLLSYLNLYRDKELNANPEDTPGFFEKNGKVSNIRLRGFPSEGFLLPYSKLQSWILSSINIELPDATKELEFDEAEHDGKTFWVCKKYIVKQTRTPGSGNKRNKRDNKIKQFNKIREDQFHFHYDTIILKKCPHVIQPNDIIHISEKIHGTSGISAYILCHQPLNWKQKIAKWLTGEEFDKYDYIYASRTVIKNQYYNKNVTPGYYGCDVWAEADKIVKPHLWKGMSAYYEIVGFLPNGGYIQKGYDYGCIQPSKDEKYTEGKHFKVRIYRITTVNTEGQIHEWSAREVQIWCKNNGLTPVTEFYYGYAKDLYKDLDPSEHWTENFLERLSNDKNFFMEMNSPSCNNKVPHEGIVIKKENMVSEAFKLKTFKFLGKESEAADKGESNIEDES